MNTSPAVTRKELDFKSAVSELYFCACRVLKYSRAHDGWKEWVALEEAIKLVEDTSLNGQLVISPEYFGECG